MDWKTEAVDNLKDYNYRKQGVENLKERIAAAESDMRDLRAHRADLIASSAKNKHMDDYMGDHIVTQVVAIAELKRTLRLTTSWVQTMDKALNALTEEERHILDVLFINRRKGAVDVLRDELCLAEPSSVYRRRDKALRKFTLVMYGAIEM